VDFLDLRDGDLPLCDGDSCYQDPRVIELERRMQSADAYVFAAPVYTYDLNAASKNVLELAGGAMQGKAVGFVMAAGGFGSYMSSMAFANSLMLDFRCVIVPRFVYAVGKHFEGGRVVDPQIQKRQADFAADLMRLAAGLGEQA
jgi:FMN reductase